jgi:hypothetical protein
MLGSFSCAKGATTASPARLRAADYHPLAVGNQWTYVGQMGGQPVERTITIRGMKDGYFVDDANGKLRIDGSGLRDDKRYLLMEPIEQGKSWTAVVSVSSTERYEIAEVDFSTTTPAGSFSGCARVRAMNRIDRERELQTDWTFAPGVGIVRIATAARVRGEEIPQGVVELKTHRIARPEAAKSP